MDPSRCERQYWHAVYRADPRCAARPDPATPGLIHRPVSWRKLSAQIWNLSTRCLADVAPTVSVFRRQRFHSRRTLTCAAEFASDTDRQGNNHQERRYDSYTSPAAFRLVGKAASPRRGSRAICAVKNGGWLFIINETKPRLMNARQPRTTDCSVFTIKHFLSCPAISALHSECYVPAQSAAKHRRVMTFHWIQWSRLHFHSTTAVQFSSVILEWSK